MRQVSPPGGGSDLEPPLVAAYSDVFTQTAGDRGDVNNVIILISHSEAGNMTEVVYVAESLRKDKSAMVRNVIYTKYGNMYFCIMYRNYVFCK